MTVRTDSVTTDHHKSESRCPMAQLHKVRQFHVSPSGPAFYVGSGPETLIPFFRQYAAFSTYFSAQILSFSRSSFERARTTRPGAPNTIDPSGISVPGVISAFAPIT